MSNHNGNANKMVDTTMPQGEQKGSSYILIQHKNHQWIERLDGPSRLPSRYSYYDETAKVVEELNRLADHIKQLEEALRRIANQDYRGNRSTESQIAFDVLKEAKL